MKFLEFNKVLCLSPHPDDVEYSMAGAILKCKNTHFDILTLTSGGDHDLTNDQPRCTEVVNFCENVDNVSLFFGKNSSFKTMDEASWVNFIEKKFLKDHDAICLPSNHDSHFEHRFTSNFGYALTRVKPISLIEYMSPSTQRSWQPNTFINIEEEYSIKKRKLKQFVSQKERSYFHDKQVDGFHFEFQCAKKNIFLVEQFKIKQNFK